MRNSRLRRQREQDEKDEEHVPWKRARAAAAAAAIDEEEAMRADLDEISINSPWVREYVRFLIAKHKDGDYAGERMSPPTTHVDAVWHLHMLYPVKYAAFCTKYFGAGNIIDHDPRGEERPDWERKQRRSHTLRVMTSLWPESTIKVVTTDGKSATVLPLTPASQIAFELHHHLDTALDIGGRRGEYPLEGVPGGSVVTAQINNADTKPFCVFLKTLTGDNATLLLEHGARTTVIALKRQIQRELSIPVDHCRLIYGGMQLSVDEKTLANYGVGRESTLHVVLRLKGC